MLLNALLRAREMLDEITPLAVDCGALCGAACCQADEDGQGGVHLFPGEAALYEGCEWATISEGDIAPILVCRGVCERQNRPLGCRIFPLTPFYKGGAWDVIMDARARGMCPLVRSGVRGLDPRFVASARRAVQLIAAEPEGEAFLKKWQKLAQAFACSKL